MALSAQRKRVTFAARCPFGLPSKGPLPYRLPSNPWDYRPRPAGQVCRRVDRRLNHRNDNWLRGRLQRSSRQRLDRFSLVGFAFFFSGFLLRITDFFAAPEMTVSTDPTIQAARRRIKATLRDLQDRGFDKASRKQMLYCGRGLCGWIGWSESQEVHKNDMLR